MVGESPHLLLLLLRTQEGSVDREWYHATYTRLAERGMRVLACFEG